MSVRRAIKVKAHGTGRQPVRLRRLASPVHVFAGKLPALRPALRQPRLEPRKSRRS